MPTDSPTCILAVDDSPDTLELLQRHLKPAGHIVIAAAGAEEAARLLKETPFNLVITDMKMPKTSGLELIRHIRDNFKNIGILMITGYPSIGSAVEAVRLGADDYLAKPFTKSELLDAVQTVLAKQHQRSLGKSEPVAAPAAPSGIIGASERMRGIFEAIEKAAAVKANVLISGESGTGKELVARSIHYNSQRNDRPFIPVDCASLVENLLETELFGHVRGAFTGALYARRGLFEEADGGTLFLDEVSNLNLSMQTKLLRFLQEHEIKRVGGTESIKVDVRVIAATNQLLEPLVKEGRFREDLFYRLNVVSIALPPLRERKEDIPLLANHFLQKSCEENHKAISHISPEALRILTDYPWPGNVRELENSIERAVILSVHPIILPEDLPQKVMETTPEKRALSLKDVEKSYVLKVLQETKGNKKKAAEILGIDRTTLYRILEKE